MIWNPYKTNNNKKKKTDIVPTPSTQLLLSSNGVALEVANAASSVSLKGLQEQQRQRPKSTIHRNPYIKKTTIEKKRKTSPHRLLLPTKKRKTTQE